jgi:uncharacterized membrane protein
VKVPALPRHIGYGRLEYILLNFFRKFFNTQGGIMERIEKSIDVECPISTVYNQWTQFEEFPRFMKGVNSVKQLDDKRLHWEAEIGGKIKEWDARITDQVPDYLIAWQSEGGEYTSGAVNFTSVNPNCTRISLQLMYDPEGFVEKTGDALGVVSSRVEGDLIRFKEFIENKGHETGAWRGTIRE